MYRRWRRIIWLLIASWVCTDARAEVGVGPRGTPPQKVSPGAVPAAKAPSLANTRFTVVDLGMDGEYPRGIKADAELYGGVNAINNVGQVVGRDGVWQNGQLFVALPRVNGPYDGLGQALTSINDHGDIAGWDSRPGPTLWRYDNGQWTAGALPDLLVDAGGGISPWVPTSVNHQRQVAGFTAEAYASSIKDSLVATNGILRSLPNPFVLYSDYENLRRAEVFQINDTGVSVGAVATIGFLIDSAVYWDPAGMHLLPVNGGSISAAHAINNLGQIVGFIGDYSRPDVHGGAALWDARQYFRLPDLSASFTNQVVGGNLTRSVAWDINRHGQVVGWSTDSASSQRAVLWDNLQVIDLNTRIPPDSGWVLNEARAINDQGMIVGAGTFNDQVRSFLLKPLIPVLAVDANRDGTIKLAGEDASDATSSANPFRFWINDDIDSGDTGGNDLPGQSDSTSPFLIDSAAADYHTVPVAGSQFDGQGLVHGTRDLIDYFPVFLDLTQLIAALPPSAEVKYRLKHSEGAVNFIYTSLQRDQVFDYQYPPAGGAPLTTGFGPLLGSAPGNATKFHVTAAGVDLFGADFEGSPAFLNAILNHGGGVILIEGRATTTQPLVLSVERPDGTVVAEGRLPLSISPVEKMFRHANFSAAAGEAIDVAPRLDAPNEGPTNGKNLVFLHGYNVNQQQARSWASEIFKKMWWSGSRAKFHAVTWRGADSQQADALTYDLQINIEHAFQTASALANFLNHLSGEVTTCAHSLGNMLLLAALNPPDDSAGGSVFPAAHIARHFALDAALAAEAVDGSLLRRREMSHSLWESQARGKIDETLWASEWHQQFVTDPHDARRKLTWRNRLAGSNGALIRNFYSNGKTRAGGAAALNLGEEVLNYRDIYGEGGETPTFPALSQIFQLLKPTGESSWYYQEVSKGLIAGLAPVLSSDYGGWGFGGEYVHVFGGDIPQTLPFSYAEIASLAWTESKIRQEPLFLFAATKLIRNSPVEPGESVAQLYGSEGSEFARRFQAKLLANMIPARTVAMGREAIQRLDAVNPDPAGSNFDLSSDLFQDDWPAGRLSDGNKQKRWLHSDAREVAYRYNHRLFEKWVALGGLNLP